MPRNIDYPETISRGQVHVGETQFNGDAPQLLFLETVGIDPGQGSDEGGLPMVDVAGSSQNYLFHVVTFLVQCLRRPNAMTCKS